MNIQAVLFDADGVTIHPWRFAAYLEREHNIRPEATAPFFRGVFNQCLVGKADLKEEIAPFLSQWGWNTSVESFIEDWMREEDAPDERMLSHVAALRANGISCYLATNQERYRAAYLRQQMNFDSVFDGMFVSCEIGAVKHDLAYYERVTALLNLPPKAILFWDDSMGNIEIARSFGWHAELFTEFVTFQETMAHYSLVISRTPAKPSDV